LTQVNQPLLFTVFALFRTRSVLLGAVAATYAATLYQEATMRPAALIIAFILALSPVAALAQSGCEHGDRRASCMDGTTWDPVTGRCETSVSS
jgi:hypothetical protein